MRRTLLALAIVVLALAAGGSSYVPIARNELLLTPPLGWSSWNKFGCATDEETVRGNVDALLSNGMAAAGYRYINVDDCWMAPVRDPQGRLQADPQRFPSGIKALADYVHARGLKFGLYESAGTVTCQNRPGSLGHEAVDARLFADWGVDLVKYDNCGSDSRPARDRYRAMANALAATRREIALAVCDWGDSKPWLWAAAIGARSWRTYSDIEDTWVSMSAILDHQVGLEKFARPDAWNDPDMLEVGNGGMTLEEYRAQVSLWAVLSAPMIAGNDLRSMDSATAALLTNRAVIRVNQQWAGSQGRRVVAEGDREVWVKPMPSGAAAVVLFNRGSEAATISASAQEAGLRDTPLFAIDDLWAGKMRLASTIGDTVPAHAVKMLLVSSLD
ncbi:alpha-galactosidase [Mycobacteroides abscessus subsp. abscessus]|nr:alpha-galactosidase [Mycobacteroides abscessus subsp. abscessus]